MAKEVFGEITIDNFSLGSGHRCFVIAEAGVNHNGDPALARELVLAAKRAGADCVKFQTFSAGRLLSAGAPKAGYQLRTTDPRENQFEMLRRLELSKDDHIMLADMCRTEHIAFMSTPYGPEDADLLASMGVGAFKLASIHCTEPNFITYVARKRKPVILSTGMATLSEVHDAVRAFDSTGNDQLILLQCTTDYPARVEDANLRAMVSMREMFHRPVGYSDHTQSLTACIAAVALGACVIEKHLTLDRTWDGPDHAASFDPGQFAALVEAVREAEASLGSGVKQPSAAELANARTMRRSLAARRHLAAGEVLTEDAVTMLRPGTGLQPNLLPRLLGRRLIRDVVAGALLTVEDFADGA